MASCFMGLPLVHDWTQGCLPLDVTWESRREAAIACLFFTVSPNCIKQWCFVIKKFLTLRSEKSPGEWDLYYLSSHWWLRIFSFKKKKKKKKIVYLFESKSDEKDHPQVDSPNGPDNRGWPRKPEAWNCFQTTTHIFFFPTLSNPLPHPPNKEREKRAHCLLSKGALRKTGEKRT